MALSSGQLPLHLSDDIESSAKARMKAGLFSWPPWLIINSLIHHWQLLSSMAPRKPRGLPLDNCPRYNQIQLILKILLHHHIAQLFRRVPASGMFHARPTLETDLHMTFCH